MNKRPMTHNKTKQPYPHAQHVHEQLDLIDAQSATLVVVHEVEDL